jgi:Swt1-like HEPN
VTYDTYLRSFGMGNLLIYHEIERTEKEYGVELRPLRTLTQDRENPYRTRFEAELRRNASVMARHYEVFYCLENTFRDFISDQMEAAFGTDWWKQKVDLEVQKEAKKNQDKEAAMGLAPRSDQAIDCVTFGQLGLIIEPNWDVFAGVLRNRQAVSRILGSLNSLRAPIAHCNPMPESEVVRLRVALQDWFRQME